MDRVIEKNVISKYWRENKDKFEKIVSVINPEKHGVYLTEGLLLCSVFDILNTDLIIESGTAYGTSAEIFANYFDIPVITIDFNRAYGAYSDTKSKLDSYSNLECLLGNSFDIVPKLLEKNKNKRVSVFIDGPKGDGAMELRNSIVDYKNVVCVGFHDIGPITTERIRNGEFKKHLSESWSHFNNEDLFHSYDIDYLFEEYAHLTDKNKKLLEDWGRGDEYTPKGVGVLIEEK